MNAKNTTTKKVVEKNTNYWVAINVYGEIYRFNSKESALDYIKENEIGYDKIFLFEVIREFDVKEPRPIATECNKSDLKFDD